MPKLMTARYAGTCAACRGEIAVGDPIVWDGRARHSTPMACELSAKPEPVAATPAKLEGVNLASVVAFLTQARDSGKLQYPVARFLDGKGGAVRLSLAGNRSRYPGAVQVTSDEAYGERQWFGRIQADGTVERPLSGNAELVALLAAIAEEPAKAASEFGALNGCCSFCGAELTDAGSVEVGYGPTCAKRWGLPHKPRGSSVAAHAA